MEAVVKPITILGAGSWGTALAILLAHNQQAVRLWGNDPKLISNLYHHRKNTHYLPNIAFPENLEVFAELSQAMAGVSDVLLVVPSHAFREVIETVMPFLSSDVRIAWGTKGLDPKTGKLLHEVVIELLGAIPMAVIAGPSFAKEVALGLPTAVTLAQNNGEFAQDMVDRLHNNNFRVYTSADMVGVQVCGAVKNILAVAVAISDGLGMGANARCALITRGLAEMSRLGMAMGGKRETFMGLAGVGDLVLTATDDQSRNRRFGKAVALGEPMEKIQKEIGQVVEGMTNAPLVYALARRMGLEMPITEQVHRILYENQSPADAVQKLLARDPKPEDL